MLAIPAYWLRPPQILSNRPGMHRFLWDMRFAPVPAERLEYPSQAIYHDTPQAASAPWVMPGNYTVKLTVNGRGYTEPLLLKMDPRVHTTQAELLQQFTVSKQLYDDQSTAQQALEQIRSLREKLRQSRERAGQGAIADAIAGLDQKVSALEGSGGGRGGRGAAVGPDTMTSVNGSLGVLMRMIQGADVAPTSQALAAAADRRHALAGLLSRWTAIKAQDLASLNGQFKQAGLPNVTVE
jgi:hypothetical protein